MTISHYYQCAETPNNGITVQPPSVRIKLLKNLLDGLNTTSVFTRRITAARKYHNQN